jgi:hypothetical protein
MAVAVHRNVSFTSRRTHTIRAEFSRICRFIKSPHNRLFTRRHGCELIEVEVSHWVRYACRVAACLRTFTGYYESCCG